MTTSTYDLERDLVRALDRIGDYWDALLPTTIAAVSGGGPRSRRSVAADYDDPNDEDLSLADRRIDLRRDVELGLNGWVRVIVEDADVEHGLPAGNDVPAMLTFLRRWAQWFSGHEAAPDALDEIRTWAYAVRAVAEPQGRDWTTIGACPRIDDETGQPCGRVVRAYLDGVTMEEMFADERHFIRCPGCGHEDTLGWWASQIVPEGARFAPANGIIAFVSVRTREVLTSANLRLWATRGHIQRYGKDIRGRTLYDATEVLEYVLAPKTKGGKVIA